MHASYVLPPLAAPRATPPLAVQLFPDIGVAAYLQNNWEDVAFSMKSLKDKEPLDGDEDLVIAASPDPTNASDCVRLNQLVPADVPLALFNARLVSGVLRFMHAAACAGGVRVVTPCRNGACDAMAAQCLARRHAASPSVQACIERERHLCHFWVPCRTSSKLCTQCVQQIHFGARF